MLGKWRVSQLLCVFALATARIALGGGGEEVSTDAWPWASPFMVTPSPDGDRFALSLRGDPDLTSPLLVISNRGEVQLSTWQSVSGVHADLPLGWFPGGRRLLVMRTIRAPVAAAKRLTDAVVLSVEDGRAESLSGGKGGFGEIMSVVDADDCVGHASGGALGTPGLYLFQFVGGEWKSRLVLADGDRRQWLRCLWAQREGDKWQMVVKAAEDGRERASYWRVDLDGAKEPTAELIAKFGEWVGGEEVSPDGSVLAGVCRRDLGSRLVLVPLRKEGGEVTNVACSDNVCAAAFSPTGRHLLLWGVGWLPGFEGREGPPAEIWSMDLASDHAVKVALPTGVGRAETLDSVAWLSEASIVLGLSNYGIVSFNLSTGASETIWRIEGCD